jgi:hypothetical protein
MVGSGASPDDYSSILANELAYRTVIVFVGNNVTGDNGQTFTSGDQLWIRGGNTINSTTIPGFPLTPADNWNNIQVNGKRAGIRLMSKSSGTATNTLANSTWQWVTWEVNAKLYYNLYLGHDADSSAAEATQYGPKQYASHIGNWTNLSEYYVAFPGERRWLASGTPNYSTQGGRAIPYTFNGSFDELPSGLTVSYP